VSKILRFFSFLLPWVFLIGGLICLALSWQSLEQSAASLECFCPSCQATEVEAAGVASLGLIKVDIQGAVKKPGLYELQTGQRLADLVAAAGGFIDETDRLFAVKTLNLAKELKNQDKIYIPFFEESVVKPQGESSEVEPGTVSQSSSGLISINQATTSQLQGLTGIGEVKSQAIIDNRPYTSLDELVSKKILSENLLNSLREQLSL
jgi:competence protein ComEA